MKAPPIRSTSLPTTRMARESPIGPLIGVTVRPTPTAAILRLLRISTQMARPATPFTPASLKTPLITAAADMETATEMDMVAEPQAAEHSLPMTLAFQSFLMLQL